jgi:hypothetical protein
MDGLPAWALWIITAAVGVAPGVAILGAPAIARLLHRVLWPRPGVATGSIGEPAPGEPVGVPASRG